MSAPWSDPELALMRAHYRAGDAHLCCTLADAGYARNFEAVRAKRIRLGLFRGVCQRPATPKQAVRPVRRLDDDQRKRDRAFQAALARGLSAAGLVARDPEVLAAE